MVVVAVKVTEVPAQITFPGLAVIVMVGITEGVTVIVILLLVAVVGFAQVALLVTTQDITSPLLRLLSV